MSVTLNTDTNTLNITQKTIFYNKSDSILKTIYFHNWPNAYRDKQTPLAKRIVENYSKSFHFAKEKQRGRTTINSISINYDIATWEITKQNPDILKINLNKPLNPNDSVKIITTYSVKLPKDKFTKYGANPVSYNLKYWYLSPAIFNNKYGWKIYSNLDLDDLYINYTNYYIKINVPKKYVVNTDLKTTKKINGDYNSYILTGKQKLDVELNITSANDFITFNSNPVSITTNLDSDKLNGVIKTLIINRELNFIQSYLGKFPHKKLLINKIEYDKNPVYGFNQLPSFLAPFSETFEWDIKFFKVLSKKYIHTIFLFNQREDAWLADGLQTYLMMKYVEKYYPEVKALGNISNLWGIKNFSLAKLNFNDKYHFVYQFAARKNLDQALTTQVDSLSNFNRKIINKYKAGLGIKFLENYLGETTITKAIIDFSKKNAHKKVNSNQFINSIQTTKDISWFKNDYLKTSKKIDYTIKKIIKKGDSLQVTISNKRNFTAPIELYGIKDKKIVYSKWLTGIDSIAKIKIPKDGFDKLSLNYESLLPEYNLRNNWKNVDKKLFNRPIQLKFLKDAEDPYYNQLFYTPVYRYNYYDGLVLGLAVSNKTILRKNFLYKLTPSYSTKSKSFSGSYSFLYEYLPEDKKVNKFSFGVVGSNYHYARNLTYNTIRPFAYLEFRRKSLRDVGSNAIAASYTLVDREKLPTQTENLETYNYKVFSLRYGYSKPEIINDFRFSTELQISSKFSKLSLTARYRKLTDTNRQFDFRFFTGAFISNNTTSNFFNFALDRPSDYLFQYDYLGRSETSGFFSQQVIMNEGAFKSKLPITFANQWMSTMNMSVGMWRWVEIYSDVGFVKNKNSKVYFAYGNGVRLNFVQDILEVYFPFYSNLGWEISQPSYSSKIRFVLVIKPKRIYNFIKRGFY
ncbi:aminopeptidase [Lutibacter sp.]|uniref:aminopeptidase n=1 Tax=Lutibacter sp. TaxID=1925666 RepID=UPI0025BD2D4C|nr:aminopeptidase [Lutibacter sp.]MCF6167931.1 aminopeptidase [Lutibacter sp.]